MSTDESRAELLDLLSQLQDPSGSSRGIAAELLAGKPEFAGESLPALRRVMVEDRDHYVRACAAFAVTLLAPDPTSGVSVLLTLLGDEDADGRWASSQFLAEIATSVPEALPQMLAALADPNEHVRFHAARYLSNTAPAS